MLNITYQVFTQTRSKKKYLDFWIGDFAGPRDKQYDKFDYDLFAHE